VKLRHYPGYMRFWAASTASGFGTYITTIAINVIVVLTLDGGAGSVGLVNAARWLPYPLLGLFAGAWVDRHPRKPILVAGDFGRGAILVSISLLGLGGWLTVPLITVHVFVFGVLSIAADAAHQSFIPELVPRQLLVRANARLGQSDSVAQTTGPALAGWFTQAVTAPAAILVDAASYFISGLVVASIQQPRPSPRPALTEDGLLRRIREGITWVYRHPRLGPLALSTNLWFVFNSMFGVAFTVFALRERELGAFAFGVVLACAGIGSVLGSLVTTCVGDALGAGRVMVLSRGIYPVAFLIIVVAGFTPIGHWAGIAAIGVGQFLVGIALGMEGPQEMGYQQAITPARLMGRMSATRRSINRGMIVIGAPVGGLLTEAIGVRPAMGVAAMGMAVVTAYMVISGVHHARMAEQLSEIAAEG
jgi:MFS family permease